jgi:hypothetical protein
MTEDRQTAPLTSAPPAAASDPRTRYLPIAEHGIIGDLHSAALVGSDGTIDWFCPDRFDGPSVFGALLDRDRGGYYRIAPTDPLASTKQLYLPDTNVLITRFLSPKGVSEIQDFMPVGGGPQRLVRSMVGTRGTLRFRLEVEPANPPPTGLPPALCGPHRAPPSGGAGDLRRRPPSRAQSCDPTVRFSTRIPGCPRPSCS